MPFREPNHGFGRKLIALRYKVDVAFGCEFLPGTGKGVG